MTILKARKEIVGVGNLYRAKPYRDDVRERLQYLRTFIFMHNLKHGSKKNN